MSAADTFEGDTGAKPSVQNKPGVNIRVCVGLSRWISLYKQKLLLIGYYLL